MRRPIRAAFGAALMVWLLPLATAARGADSGVIDVTSEAAQPDDSQRRAKAYGHLMRAVFAVREGEVGRAIDEIERAVAMQPTSADLLAESADLLRWTGRQREAEGLARRAIALDPDHAQATRIVAQMAARRALGGDDDAASLHEALSLYSKLALADDAEPESLKTLVELRVAAGDLDGAVSAGRELVARRPGDLEAAQSLAQLLARMGDPDGALGVLIAYLARHPDHEDLFAFVERQVIEREAWAQFDGILDDDGQVPRDAGPLHRLQGEARLRLGNMAGAVESLELARAAGPSDTRTDYFLGVAYQSVGRMADAATMFAELVERVPDHFGYRRRLAEALEAQGRRDAAIAEFREALRTVPEEEGASLVRDAIRQRLAGLAIARGESVEAATWLGRLENDDQPGAAEMRAQIALVDGDSEAARAAALRLRAMDRPGVASLIEAEAAVGDGDWSAAERLFTVAADEIGPFARHRAVRAWSRAELPDRAERVLRQWVEREPESVAARYALGVFLHQHDRFEDGERELRETIRLQPTHGAALNYLGYSLVERGDRLEEALELVRRAVEIEPWNGAFLDSLGWALYHLGRFDEALEPMQSAVRELPTDPTVLEHLGDLYLELSQPVDAIDTWRRALDAGPDEPAALQAKIERVEADAARGSASSTPTGRVPHAELRPPRTD